MVMTRIPLERAQRIATKAGLRPARVKGTEVVQFTRRGGANLEVIDWGQFETTLRERRLRVYESDGWLKIMK